MIQVISNGGTGDKVWLCKINSQPEILTDVSLRASHGDWPAVSGSLRNLRYQPVSSSSFSLAMLERSYYSGTKNSPINGANHKPLYAIDNQVDHSQVAGNYRSKWGYTKPFIELALSQAVDIAGLEITTFGAANIRRFQKVIFRAGLVRSPVGGPGSGNNLLTHNPLVMEYMDKAFPGEVIYLTFPYPRTAKFILLQGNANPADTTPTSSVILELAEVRVIKCKSATDPIICSVNCSRVVPALYSGCPMAGRKLTGSGEEVVSSVQTWGDCSLTCQARGLCTGWAWQSSSLTCRTLTGPLTAQDQQDFTSGARDCQPAANITGWITCNTNNPFQSASNDARYEVRSSCPPFPPHYFPNVHSSKNSL